MSDSQLGIVLRPSTFEEVIGHDEVITTLRTKLDKGEVPRAMMFVGPAGTGKTTLARIIARAVQGWDFDPNTEPEVVEINAADFRKIDDMRELMSAIHVYPMVGKYRVVILDEAHQLTKDAQNLLLKPFEDSEARNVFIICTTETTKVIPAIRTRCQTFALTVMSKRNVHDLLVRAAKYLGKDDFAEFEAQAIAHKLFSPRPLLSAFENYVNGTNAVAAIVAQTSAALPEYFELAKAVVYGSWDKDGNVWGQPCASVKSQLETLEKGFKKSKGADADDDESGDDSDAVGRPEAARGLRAIVAALLKGEVIKRGSVKAAESLQIISKCAPDNPADAALEYPATVGGLLRVNIRMTTK